MLEVKNIEYKRYDKCIFQDISMTLSPGDLVVIKGENGSGKSTLLGCISGLHSISDGNILWMGENILNISQYFNNLHYIGHKNGLKPNLTVYQNLIFYASITNPGKSKNELNELLHDSLSKINIDISCLEECLGKLSFGQQQKVSLTRLFFCLRKLWILDEPLTGLDSESRQVFLESVHKHLNDSGLVIFSTHQKIEELNSTYTVWLGK